MFRQKPLPYILMALATVLLMWLICGCTEAFMAAPLGPGGEKKLIGPGGEEKPAPPAASPAQKEAEQSLFSAPLSCPGGKPSGGYPCCPNGEPSYGQPCK